MTGGAINLNRFRKAKRRKDKEAAAAANRVKFGRTKAEKARDAAERARHDGVVEGARREDGPDQD